ncbi:tRNA modification GTPase [Bremerella cremea]|uniref:tRNA modification GTPase n=1 Tax=Bremerella cremea TaxID=1031537 RepID=UPI0031ECCC95
MAFDLEQTIVAISSAPGIGARSIVRLSGPDSVQLAMGVTTTPDATDIARAQVVTREVCLPEGRTMPADFWIWPTSRSYTRQPQVEMHLPGSRPIADEILRQLRAAGAQLAQPGEFTMRAFLAGRLDLTQAEAVLGVIDAQGEQRFQSALKQLSGGLSGPLQSARDELIELLALLEAGLDFVEEDIEFITNEELHQRVTSIYDSLSQLRDQIQNRTFGQAVSKVVLLGLPNAGKSSLFNALTESHDAIISPVAGTTRDFISKRVHWHGIDLELIDTAGHETVADTDLLGKFMEAQTRFATDDCDLGLLCVDVTSGLSEAACQLQLRMTADRLLVVATKGDSSPDADASFAALTTSAITLSGVKSLQIAILERLADLEVSSSELVPATAVRCLGAIEATLGALTTSLNGISGYHSEELIASEIRFAISQLAEVVGAVYTDDLLDVIFSRFCIGK